METIICLNEDIACGQEVKLKISVVEPSAKRVETQKIKWADQDPNASAKVGIPKRKRRQVVHLCTPLKSARESRIKLHLLTEGEAIYLEDRSQPVYTPEDLIDAVSLSTLSSSANAVITEETKLIIAVILGHTLIHSYNTPWIKNWKLENIVFIRCGNTVPLRPFLVSRHAFKEGDEDDDEAYFSRLHADPDILGLGIMLLELSLKQSIHAYTNNEFVNVRYNADYLAAQSAYTKHQRDLHLRYRSAIEQCLDCDFASDLEDLGDIEEARQKIYQDIVKLLEDELEAGFRDWVDVENLDTEVRQMDVAGYGERFHVEDNVTARQLDHSNTDGEIPTSTVMELHQDTIQLGVNIVEMIPGRSLPIVKVQDADSMPDLDTVAGHETPQTTGISPTRRRSRSPLHRRPTELPIEMHGFVSGFSLFDDFQPEEQMSVALAQRTDSWFEKFQRLTDTIDEGKCPPIKVAILDTGIDLQHNDIVACAERIRDVRSWADGSHGVQDWASGDQHGHGTHVAGILMDCAAEADIYIAKITQDEKSISTDCVAKVIE
ncbi:hypothetical protein SLS60_004282 [Paraconiothyrium brasiliense]|uniref:Subtilisin n=1 Tax=Paraconiothyrium brasiliense TaxID=300254 RepID=A0ABR3RK34_9PLEO